MGHKAGWLIVVGLSSGAAIASSAGCQAPRPAPSVSADDVDLKVVAMKEAAQRKDRSQLPALVDSLESDDPAVRFYAIAALEQFAGSRMGYDYFREEDDVERKAAVARWREWLKGQRQESGK